MQPVQRISWAIYHRQPNNGVSDTARDRLFNCDFVVARAQPGEDVLHFLDDFWRINLAGRAQRSVLSDWHRL